MSANSCVPRPFLPITPWAWLSSTTRIAPNSSQIRRIPGRSAIDPSMENTPSVTTQICPVASGFARAFSSALRSDPSPSSVLFL